MTRLCDERYEEIKMECAKFYDNLGIDHYPINSLDLAKKMGYILIPYTKFGHKKRTILYQQSDFGFQYVDNHCTKIYYNDEKSDSIINNTIMHEIAHRVLDHKEPSQIAEAEAKFFAKYVLAPPFVINKMNLNSVESVSKYFNISNLAAKYALEYANKRKLISSVQTYEKSILNQINLLKGGGDV